MERSSTDAAEESASRDRHRLTGDVATKPKTILFYVDSASTLAHCASAAAILREKLSARIVMMVIDSQRHRSGPLHAYEVYDYASLFRSRRGFVAEWGAPSLGEDGRGTIVTPFRVGALTGVLHPGIPFGSRILRRIALVVAWLMHVAMSRHLAPAQRLRFVHGLMLVLGPFLLAFVAVDRFLLLPLRRAWRAARRLVRTRRTPGRVGALIGALRPCQSVRSRVATRMALAVAWGTHVTMRGYLGPEQRKRIVRGSSVVLGPLLVPFFAMELAGELVQRRRRLADSYVSPAWRLRLRSVMHTVIGPPLRVCRRAARHLGEARRGLGRLRYWLASVRGVRRFVAHVRPDAILLPEDNIETISRAFVTYGRRQRARTLILPYTIPNPLEPANFYFENPRHQVHGPLARAVAWWWPKWVMEHRGRALLRLNPGKIVMMEAMGFATNTPWILNSGDATAIALDSDIQRDIYLRLGFPLQQLRVIGDTNGELLAAGLREAAARRSSLVEQLGMKPGRPIILCAFPPDQYSGSSTSGYEHRSFDDMVAAWMRSFQSLGEDVNVIIRPHPRLDVSMLAAFERPNIRISLEPTVQLVPLCDLFVASISATIRWAIACGIPVINYDCYRLRYGDYAGVESVLNVEDCGAFADTLKRVIQDRDFAEQLRRKQTAVSPRWGIVDSHFGDRLTALLAEILPMQEADAARDSSAATRVGLAPAQPRA